MAIGSPVEIERQARWGGLLEYTATWASTGTQPAKGNGVVRAACRRDGSVGVVRFQIIPGSTTTFGTGAWSLTLPTGWAAGTSSQQYQMGWLMLNDTGTAVYTGLCYVDPGGTSMHLRYGSPWSSVTNTAPFTWVNGDFLSGGFDALVLDDPL